ncbi:Agamous-like MADS-box protein [Arachis hypogaea]|nr:Agamous-like MADS-box protein [Arachis hypogaea]
MKKFSDKCKGSEACLIVYEEGSNAAPMIWPKDSNKVKSLIKKYEAQKNVRPPKIFDLQDFFEHKKTSVEAETSKVRKCIYSVEYPTSDLNIQSLDLEQLRMFIGILDNKIDSLYSIIQNGALVNSTKVKEPEPMVHYDTNVMEDTTTNKKDEEVRLVCTEKTIDKVNSTNQVSEALDWKSQFAEAEAWASDFGEFENWMN